MFGREPRRELVGPAAGQRLRFDSDARGTVRRDREVRQERQLLQADEPRTFARGDRHTLGERGFVRVGVGPPTLLHEPDAHRRPARRVDAGGGVEELEGGAQDHRDTGTGWVMQCTPPPP